MTTLIPDRIKVDRTATLAHIGAGGSGGIPPPRRVHLIEQTNNQVRVLGPAPHPCPLPAPSTGSG